MSQIIPALITSDDDSTNDFKELKLKFKKLQPFLSEFNNWIQIDITDGKFVPTKTNIELEDLRYFTEKANVEFHLMLDKPEETIGEWARLGPKRIIVHIEAIENMARLLDICREKEIEIGLALNPETANIMIEPWLNDVDLITFLGVHPGKSGQEFIPEVLDKIKALRQNFPNVKIEVDGGARKENIEELKEAGADIIVVGKAIKELTNV
ncbi:MAG: ribulose-phosphate 3-epimerase [Candidatus Azambacteria bacterium]|nr:ribulose-phosphate 3-epimerase [Candidatus Azambacteria bacterium]